MMKIIIKNKQHVSEFMQICTSKILHDVEFDQKMVVVLGNFDGVHLGHLEIIKRALKRAEELNTKVVLYTFRKYPKKNDNLITILLEKLTILERLRIDYVYLEEFSDVHTYEPEEFVNVVLLGKLNAQEIFCGFNYTFGKNKKGDTALLEKLIEGRANLNIVNPVVYNLSTNDVKEVECSDLRVHLENGYQIISSTFIKSLIETGQMNHVEKLLVHKYIIMGKVIHGKKIARKLGFPTANLEEKNKKYPIYGVYGVSVKIECDDKEYLGIMNIGKSPTVKNEGIHIETHIFDFDQDIYGKILEIKVHKNIRLERKMKSLDELKEQISNDIQKWSMIIHDNSKNN